MESPPSSPCVFFPLLSDEEFQHFSELLSWDQSAVSSPHDDEASASFFLFNANNLHPLSPLTLPPSPATTSPQSPPFSSPHQFAAKRDWLSSLYQSPPPPTSAAPPRPCHRILADAYSFISSSHSLSACTSSSTQNLSPCKSLPSSNNHRHLNDASGHQCNNIDDDPQPTTGVNAYGVVLRLSDIKAALQAHLSDSGTLQNGVILQEYTRRKPYQLEGQLASKRAKHIRNDRERRQGMKDLYRTLHSLLPDRTSKVNKCSMLTRTMEYINFLQKQLDELDKEKEKTLMLLKERKADKNKLDVKSITLKKSHSDPKHKFLKASLGKHARNEDSSSTFATNHERRKKDHVQGISMVGYIEELKSFAKVTKRKNPMLVSTHNKNKNSHTSSDKCHSVTNCVDSKNAEENPLESHQTRVDICVRFFGKDVFLSVCTSKRQGAWSSLLEALQQLGIHALNVTLSTGPNFYHHRIHAKASSSCTINSFDLQQRLTKLATKA